MTVLNGRPCVLADWLVDTAIYSSMFHFDASFYPTLQLLEDKERRYMVDRTARYVAKDGQPFEQVRPYCCCCSKKKKKKQRIATQLHSTVVQHREK